MTEQEKFEAWAEVELNRYGCQSICEAAWMECAAQKQAEIDALRDELKLERAHNLMLMNATLRAGDIFRQLKVPSTICDDIRKAINATSESVEAYRQEIIKQAKEEQRANYISVLREAAIALAAASEIDQSYDRAYRAVDEAIRNNKE